MSRTPKSRSTSTDAARAERAISRILPDQPEKVHQIMQVIDSVTYRSHAQSLHDQWTDRLDDDDVYRPARQLKPANGGCFTTLCRNLCWDPLCYCLKCGSCGVFCMAGSGLTFFGLYQLASYIVSLYKVE